MNIIECKNLTKEYISGDNTVKAVNNISVCFEKGEFCAVTGPSGSGKSTFIHMLSSLEYPTSGEVIYDGKSLGKFSDDQLSILRRRRFGFVFQSYNLVQELTGYENILLPVMLDKKKPDEEYLNDIIKTLGISNRIDHLPSAMSGGQQQRIAIARALANKPSILLQMNQRAIWTARAAERCFPCSAKQPQNTAQRLFLLLMICMLPSRRKEC